MEYFKSQGEIARGQRCGRMMRYYLGYYGWIPAILAILAAIADATGYLPTVVGKLITLFIAILSLGSLWLQKPEKDEAINTLKELGVNPPSFVECVRCLLAHQFCRWKAKGKVRVGR